MAEAKSELARAGLAPVVLEVLPPVLRVSHRPAVSRLRFEFPSPAMGENGNLVFLTPAEQLAHPVVEEGRLSAPRARDVATSILSDRHRPRGRLLPFVVDRT